MATGATAVTPKFSDSLTLQQLGRGGEILPTTAETTLNNTFHMDTYIYGILI